MIQTSNIFLKIDNYNLVASNAALLQDAIICHLTADTPATSTSLSVDNLQGIAANDWILIGDLGSSTSEIRKVNTVTGSTTISLTGSALVFDHYRSTNIYRVPYDKIEFSRATTLTGSKTVLSGAPVTINPKSLVTTYQDTNTTGYGFVRFSNSQSGEYSEYSTGVAYTGKILNSVYEIARSGASLTALGLNTQFTQEQDIIADVYEAIDIIVRTGDWAFEKSYGTITTTTNENSYDLTSLNMKHPGVKKSIFDVYFGAGKPLKFLSYDQIQNYYRGSSKTYVAGATYPAGSTSMVLDDVSELTDSGTLYILDQTITYTTVTDSTNTISGIPASGLGSITSTISQGDVVLQNVVPSEPSNYTIDNSSILLDRPVNVDISGLKIKINYLKAQDPITSMQDVVNIPFYQCIKDYIAYKIEMRRKRPDYSQNHYTNFTSKIQLAQATYMLPTTQEYDYWTFGNQIKQRNLYINDSDNNLNP